MSFMEKFLAFKKPKTYTIDKKINRQTIVDQMAAFLYASSIINDNQDITNIQFSDLFGVSDTEYVTMKIHIKEVSTKK